ncbi:MULTISPECIES: hypothetical protein [Xanthomonas]|uniref:hypothetical protein n=1 Tax=Xanthomonas TaxID=338 RepID=UPI000D4D8E81|nr:MULTISPECIES: hypothetical protein [Xanthomonas]MBV6790078.1 hypothetical protein [Xanthomonas campestris pv. clerodendri]MCF8818944.1 hypothetical protein [Xanthomonas campestris]PPU44632.1 hypothetical protein XarbCFBP7697_01580 [Xanthomonas arboricola]
MAISQSDTDSALGRLRESSQFFLKLDFALLGAILAIASLFKLDGRELLIKLASYTRELQVLGILVAYALALELLVTWLRNGLSRWIKEHDYSRLVSICTFAYGVQVSAHIFIVGGITGFVHGVLDCLSEITCSGT